MKDALLTEIVNGYQVQVFYDQITDPLDIIDPSIFETDKELQEYLDEFRKGFKSFYWICVKKLCACCNQPGEVEESLGAIEGGSAAEALEFYFSSGYAPEYLESKVGV